MQRILLALTLALCAAFPAAAAAGPPAGSFPELIPLPDGWQPEGIDTRGEMLYAGSLATGAVWRGSVRTGEGAVLVPPQQERTAAGLKVRGGRLFVAGGQRGAAYVYDARTGEGLAAYSFEGAGFVNDVVVTRRAAYFTDSLVARLYVVPIGRGGRLGEARTLELSGDLRYTEGFNANGIEATPDGRRLIVVQSNTGKLFTVDPRTGRTREIDLGGGTVTNGDGILLRHGTLYVVRNRDNRVAVVHLARGLRSGRIVGALTDPDFDVPTTLAAVGPRLYAVNARFGTPPTPQTTYAVVQLG
jgi:sugar lactone lactonase YvrE